MTKPAMDLVRETLEFYSDQGNYILHSPLVYEHFVMGVTILSANGAIVEDDGKRAREALSKLPKVKTREEFMEWMLANTDVSINEIYDFLMGSDG